MARIVILVAAVLLLGAMAVLTVIVATSEATSPGGLVLIGVGLFVILVLGVGIVGALAKPPRQ
jgi:hypothetical protein